MSTSSLKSLAEEIDSLEATTQVVHAFELLAMVHLPSLRKQAEAVRDYCDAVLSSIEQIARHGELRYSVQAEGLGERDLVVLITSSMGMCGSYNQEVFAALEQYYDEQGDDAAGRAEYLVIGSRGLRYLTERRRTVLSQHDLPLERVDVTMIAALATAAVARVRGGTNRRVLVAYTQYQDAVTSTARVAQLYPLALPAPVDDGVHGAVVDFELHPAQVLEQFVDSYAIGQLYAWLRYSVAAEYGQRRITTNMSRRTLRESLTDRRRTFRKVSMAAESAELLDIISGQQAVRSRRRRTGARHD